MQIIKESNFTTKNLKSHIDKHHDQYENDIRFKDAKTDEDFARIYDTIGDRLSKMKVGKSDSRGRFVGFIDKQNRRVKFDKATGDFVVYSGPSTISLHKKTVKQYKNILRRDFKSEFPYNK